MTRLHHLQHRIARRRRAHRSTARDQVELRRLLHAQLRAEVHVDALQRDASAARDPNPTGQLSLDLLPKDRP